MGLVCMSSDTSDAEPVDPVDPVSTSVATSGTSCGEGIVGISSRAILGERRTRVKMICLAEMSLSLISESEAESSGTGAARLLATNNTAEQKRAWRRMIEIGTWNEAGE